MHEHYAPAPPPMDTSRPGSKGRWKWVAIGCAGALVLSVALAALVMFTCSKAVGKAFSDDPAHAEEVARELVDYEIPGGSKGVFSMDMFYRMAAVSSLDEPPTTVLVVASIPTTGTNMSPEQLEQQIQQSLEQQNQQQQAQMQYVDTLTRHLCDQDVDVRVQQGTVQTPAGTRATTAWQATMARDDEMLLVQVNATGENADTLCEQVFDSISCK